MSLYRSLGNKNHKLVKYYRVYTESTSGLRGVCYVGVLVVNVFTEK